MYKLYNNNNMLPYLPNEIVNMILTFRPTHPVAILINNNVEKLLKDYLYMDYEDRYELYEDDELKDITTKLQKEDLRPVSIYRRALQQDKEYFEKEIKIYSNEENYTDQAYIIGNYIDFSLDPIDYDYIELCKKNLKYINELVSKFTLYRDIELLYNFNDEYFINLGVMSSDWIKQQHHIK